LLLRFVCVARASYAALAWTAPVERAISSCALAQALLLLLEAMQQVDDDVAYTREEVVEARLGGFLAERFLEDATEQFGDISQIIRVDANGVECARGNVELVAQTHIDIGDLALGGGAARP
jgi:hypothetical protein